VVFSDQQVDVGGIDDRRGGGAGGPIAIGGGGLGIVGVLIYVLVGVLGGDPGQLVQPGGQVQSGGGTSESTTELSARCNTEGAIDQYFDCYLIKVYNEVNETWTAEFTRLGGTYQQPGLAFFEQAVTTGCGNASSQVGPFYCPPDQKIYIDIGFLEQLQRDFEAEGRFAAAYIMAHEAGHHLQTLLGTEREMREAQQRNPDQANALSVALELQADCYAGAWSKLSDERGNVTVREQDLDQALNAAAAVGDDRIQQRTQGRVDPESWTHGSAADRKKWFQVGLRNGDLNSCNTFR
jgi:hypothetical protein